MEVAAREGACALLTTPGAAKWYRSAERWARSRVSISASAASVVEWLPQETIVFDGAHADISWEAHLEGDARLVAWDIVRIGRTASGERFTHGELRSTTRLWRDGRLAWIERARIEPDSPVTRAAAGLSDLPVYGTLVCAAPAMGAGLAARCREVRCAQGETGVTCLPQLLIARFRGASTQAVRDYFLALWSILRPAVAGREALAPRIWST
jgi:urease accessory protein